MRIFYLIWIIVLSGLSAKSQLSGIKSIPGDYPDLAAAITALNNQGPGSGGVTFNVLASQTALAGGYIITATGTSSNPVIFLGNRNTVSAAGTAAVTDGIFKLAGSDYITINNFILTGDEAVEWGVALLKKNSIAPYDGCNHNNLANLTISLNKTNAATVGIYAAHHTTGGTNLLAFTSEAGETNSYNSINGNTISNVYQGIFFSGIQGVLYSRITGSFDTLNNFGTTNANHISEYGGGTAPAYGIRLKNFSDAKINNNSISWSGENGANVYGVDASSGFGAITVEGNTITMSGNIIDDTIRAINCTENFITNSQYIRNNYITGCNISTVNGVFMGINANIFPGYSPPFFIEGNTISDNNLSGGGDPISYGGYMYLIKSNSGSPDISGNDIHGNTGGPASVFGIHVLQSLSNIFDNQIYLNSIVANSGSDYHRLYGIYAEKANQIFNNEIHDLSISGTAVASFYLEGIHSVFVNAITGNTISRLHFSNSSGASVKITGILEQTYWAIRLSNNKVFDLVATTGAESVVFGIETNTAQGVLFNNIVGDLHASAANGSNAVCGISVIQSGVVNVDYNTVMLSDTSTGNGFGSSAIFAAININLKLRNNILINKSAAGANGYTVAFRRTTTSLTNYHLSSGNNLYYAGDPGPHNLIFYDGTNADQTLAAFKNRVYPRDAMSIGGYPAFVSTDGSSENFLHINSVIPTQVESGGVKVSGITNDFDGNVRQGNPGYNGTGVATDIGADEFEGHPLVNIDFGAVALSSPAYSCLAGSTAAVPVIINVKNYGLTDISFNARQLTITVVVTGAITQTLTTIVNNGYLGSEGSADYLVGYLNMDATSDFYVFNAYTTIAGDTTGSNNSMPQATRVIGSLANLPDSVHFTGYDGNNLAVLFPGWYEANGQTTPMGSTSLWKTQVGLGNPDNISARVNLHSSGHNEWIVGPQFWVTDSVEFKFDIAITAKDNISTPAVMGSDDTISVIVFEDCSGNWYTIRQFTASDSLSSTLTTKKINLYPSSDRRLIIALKASDGTIVDPEDYDVHIDNIVLSSPFADFEIVSLVSPGLGCYGSFETVSVAIKNFSILPILLDPVFAHITVSVTGPVTTTFTRTLNHMTFAPGQVMNFDMPGTLNMSLPGIYRFNASISLAGDPDTGNNRLQEVTRMVQPTVTLQNGTPPLQFDFTGYDGNNLATAFQGWNEGAGTSNPAGGESSWTNCSDLGTQGNVSAKVRMYSNTTNEWIISPYFQPSPAIELKLKLALTEHSSLTNSAVMGSDDKVSVMISIDCGVSWTSLKDFTAADSLTPILTEFTIYNPNYWGKKVLLALRATDGFTDDPADYDFHIDDLRLQSVPFPLPVELVSFSGQRTGSINLLKWATASEQNVKGFRVERSTDAVHYDSVAFEKSKANGGNSTVQLDYELADNNITGDKQYYRLRQYDIDGRSQLSNVIVIRNTNPETKMSATLYPNPVTNKLLVEIQTPYRDGIKIIVINKIGQIVKEKIVVVEKGVNTIDLDVQNLVSGVYTLKTISKTTGEVTAGKFVKL